MLVLSRRTDESIVINGEITITVLGVDRQGQVRLGIDAPKQYRVLRQELLDEVRSENSKALAQSSHVDALASLGLGVPKSDSST